MEYGMKSILCIWMFIVNITFTVISWWEKLAFSFKFQLFSFLTVHLTWSHHWLRHWLGASQAPSHCLNQRWCIITGGLYMTASTHVDEVQWDPTVLINNAAGHSRAEKWGTYMSTLLMSGPHTAPTWGHNGHQPLRLLSHPQLLSNTKILQEGYGRRASEWAWLAISNAILQGGILSLLPLWEQGDISWLI